MPYIGRGLTTGAQYQKLDAIAINNATTFTMSVGSSNVSPDQNHLILVVNGVIQEPGTGFTVSGSTCTLASAITTSGHSGLDTIYGVIAGDAAFAAYDSIGANALGVTAGTVTASRAIVPDGNKDIASFRNVTLTGELDAATLDISGNADIDGTTNLDAVDIDGAVQIDSTVTVGVDDTGYDVKFFGATASAYMLWDASADDLVLAGAAGIDLAGDIDVDGTANLDVVDIDGAVDMASTLQVDGTATFGNTSSSVVTNIKTTGGSNHAGLSLEVPASGTGDPYINFKQGSGDGSANNMNYQLVHDTSEGYFKFRSADSDGSSTDADIWRVVDGTDDFIIPSGNVGIGTTSATDKLTIDSTSDPAIVIKRTNASTQINKILTDSAGLYFQSYGHATGGNNQIIFMTEETDDSSSPTERMRIESDGKVGIGTASPVTALDVHSAGTEVAAAFGMADDGTAWATTRIGETQNNYGAYGFMVGSAAVDGVSSSNCTSYIASTVENVTTGGGSSLKGSLKFYTNGGDSLSKQMTIATDGATTVHANSASNYGLFVHNDGDNTNRFGIKIQCGHQSSGTNTFINFFESDGGNHGSITQSGTTTAYNTSSDYRLKENEVLISDGLTRLNQLKPYRFNFKTNPDKKLDGFFAHEVSSIVPEAITGDKDAMRNEEYEVTPAVLDDKGIETTPAVMETRSVPDYQKIDQSKLVPLLVKAVQELSAKVEALENA